MDNTAIDPWTNEEFEKRRSNQIYACRKNQVQSNNNRARNRRKAMANINKALDQNRKILQSILGDEEYVKRSKDFLLGAGYHFGVLTHHENLSNLVWDCVYEYGIAAIEEEYYIISKIA